MKNTTFFEKNRLEKKGMIKISLPENESFDAKEYFLARMYPRGRGYGFPNPGLGMDGYCSRSILYKLSAISNMPDIYFNIFELKFDPNMNHHRAGLKMKEILSNLDIGLLSEKELWYVIAELTKKQLNGEEGNLVVNSCGNIIGRILCEDNIIRVINVHWISSYKQWRISCYPESNAAVEREGQVLQLIKKQKFENQ